MTETETEPPQRKYSPLWRRLFDWLEYNVVLALTPLLAGFLARLWAQPTPTGVSNVAPELLFFSLTISVTSVRDLRAADKAGGLHIGRRFLAFVLNTGAVFSAIFYGYWVADVSVGSIKMQQGLEETARMLATVLGVCSLVGQISLGLLESRDVRK